MVINRIKSPASKVRLEQAAMLQATCPIKCFCGFDTIEEMMKVRDSGEPFLFMDHSYFMRKERNYRVLYSSIHRTEVKDYFDDKRIAMFRAYCAPWQTKILRDMVCMIPTPTMIDIWYKCQKWNRETEQELKKLYGRRVYVKPKDGNPLPKARAFVVHSSVAAVEAAQGGIPVFGPPTSPAHGIGQEDLTKIDSPIYPDRTNWVRTLTYSQFTLDEIKNGTAWAIIREESHK